MTKFQYQKTPENSPYIVPSPSDPSKTRLSLEGFRFWCFMPGEAHHEFGLTPQELEIWDSDPVLSGSNEGQEWCDGPAYMYVTVRKLIKDNHDPDSKAMRDLMEGLDQYEIPGDPVGFTDYLDAEDFLFEFFTFADLEIRTLIYETFRDNFDTLLAEAEIERAKEPSQKALEDAKIIEPEIPYKNPGLEGL